VLDAASFHHTEQDKHYKSRLDKRLKTKIDVSKDKELELADVVITASELAAASYRQHVRDKPIVPIPLGVDTELFSAGNARRWESALDPFIFAFVGAGTENKGFDTVLEAMDALHHAKLNVELWVAGHLELKISHRARIKVLGMLGHKDLSGVLRQTHCLVLPSRFDSFGLVVLEALASGIPVIVSEMVGAKQLIIEGDNGFIIPPGDVDALSCRMRGLAEDRSRAAIMGSAARRTAEQHSWPEYHESVCEVLVASIQKSERTANQKPALRKDQTMTRRSEKDIPKNR
jgi:glycosyltransferase involved in cell wall biosynthesis